MTKLLKISFILASILVYSCISTKSTDVKDGANEKTAPQNIAKTTDKSMKEKGFSKATISIGKNKQCSHILTLEEYKDKLDPINLADFFKSNIPEKVWVKHNDLRMMNRCAEARPVSIVKIIERKE